MTPTPSSCSSCDFFQRGVTRCYCHAASPQGTDLEVMETCPLERGVYRGQG